MGNYDIANLAKEALEFGRMPSYKRILYLDNTSTTRNFYVMISGFNSSFDAD